MKKLLHKMAVCILTVWAFLPVTIYAAAVDTESLEKALPEEIREEMDISPQSGDFSVALKGLLQKGVQLVKTSIRQMLAEGSVIVAVAACSGLFLAFAGPLESENLKKAIETTAICAVTAFCIGGASGLLESCRLSIRRLSSFSAVFVPVYGAAVTLSGHPASALSSATATLVASDLLLALATRLLIPMIYLHIIFLAAGRIAENNLLGGLADILCRSALGFFKYFLMLYTGYISISGLISSGADALALRTAKTTISGSVPVLGSVISDVSEALLSGAVVLKNSIGVYGFIGAVALCLAPFISAALRFWTFKVLAMVAAGMSGGRLAGLLSGIAESYAMALGLLGTCCALLFLSFVVGSVVIG